MGAIFSKRYRNDLQKAFQGHIVGILTIQLNTNDFILIIYCNCKYIAKTLLISKRNLRISWDVCVGPYSIVTAAVYLETEISRKSHAFVCSWTEREIRDFV